MNEQEICDLLRYGIVYARHTINDLKHHKAFGDEHEKAISVMNDKDRLEFLDYVESNVSYNPHIMVISKKGILDKWFSSLFEWLFKCENVHGFDKLKGYDTQRLYAFLGERYLSFWFKKYTIYRENHWRLIE